ncbi:MAG: hypothetical protein ACE5E9_04785 [Nitrospinaceae bacterium]
METVFFILGIVFAGVMLFMLPKYAKFINEQPKARLEEIRRKELEEKAAEKSGENSTKE